MKMVFGTHAVKRIAERHIPIDAVWQIATVGVVVETRGIRRKKRGEFDGHTIDVIVEEPNVIVSAFPHRTVRITKP